MFNTIRRKDKINTPVPDMAAEFANQVARIESLEAQLMTAKNQKRGKISEREKLFRDSIIKLLFSNFEYGGDITERDKWAIEYYLLMNGRVGAVATEFDAETRTPKGIFFGRPEVSGMVDFNGFPIDGAITGYSSQRLPRTGYTDKFCVGFDSTAHMQMSSFVTPLYMHVVELSRQLTDAYEAWRVAADSRKCGLVFAVETKKEGEILRQVLTGINENNPYIIIENKNIDNSGRINFTPQNTAALSEFHTHFINTWSAVLDLLGLENSPQNKRERLIASEAEHNRNVSKYLGADRLKARQTFCNEIKERLGYNITVTNYLANLTGEEMEEATNEV